MRQERKWVARKDLRGMRILRGFFNEVADVEYALGFYGGWV